MRVRQSHARDEDVKPREVDDNSVVPSFCGLY